MGVFIVKYNVTAAKPIAETTQPMGGDNTCSPTQVPNPPIVRNPVGRLAKLMFRSVSMFESFILIPNPPKS